MKLEEILKKNEASMEKDDLRIVIPLVQKIKPKVVLEIGSWRGYSAQTWLRSFNPQLFITIEKEREAVEFIHKRLYANKFEEDHGMIALVESDSHEIATRDSVETLLKDRKVDYLFIDGDHSYEGVKKDFEMYSPFVREGGIIAFHDALFHADKTEEVDIFWNEIKGFYPYREVQEGKNSTGFGILYV